MLVLSRSATSKANELAAAKAEAVAVINSQIGSERQKYITSLPGQESIYAAKEAEAVRYLAADPEPATLDAYPFLAAEVGVTAPTAYELSQLWLNMSTWWRATGAALEQVRLGAIAQVEEASDVPAVLAVLDALEGTEIT